MLTVIYDNSLIIRRRIVRVFRGTMFYTNDIVAYFVIFEASESVRTSRFVHVAVYPSVCRKGNILRSKPLLVGCSKVLRKYSYVSVMYRLCIGYPTRRLR